MYCVTHEHTCTMLQAPYMQAVSKVGWRDQSSYYIHYCSTIRIKKTIQWKNTLKLQWILRFHPPPPKPCGFWYNSNIFPLMQHL